MNVLEGILWLTLNVYHEARSEPQIGQVAVAQVTLNRARKAGKPIKEVVLAPYQFSWTLKSRDAWVPKEWGAFMKALEAVTIAVKSDDVTYGATHYHRYDIHPYWADDMKLVVSYGDHKFLK
jgi:N-acetylmuramoyl-L-alanine amidase